MLLTSNSLIKTMNHKLLFKTPRLTIDNTDRIGIVGDNASGKTTLLNILSSRLQPDKGTIKCSTKTHLTQQIENTLFP